MNQIILAVILSLHVASALAAGPSCKDQAAEKRLAGRRADELHNQVPKGCAHVVRRVSGGTEIGWRSESELHDQVRRRCSRQMMMEWAEDYRRRCGAHHNRFRL